MSSFVERFVKSTGGTTLAFAVPGECLKREDLARLAQEHKEAALSAIRFGKSAVSEWHETAADHYEAAAGATDPNIAGYHVHAAEDAARSVVELERGLRA